MTFLFIRKFHVLNYIQLLIIIAILSHSKTHSQNNNSLSSNISILLSETESEITVYNLDHALFGYVEFLKVELPDSIKKVCVWKIKIPFSENDALKSIDFNIKEIYTAFQQFEDKFNLVSDYKLNFELSAIIGSNEDNIPSEINRLKKLHKYLIIEFKKGAIDFDRYIKQLASIENQISLHSEDQKTKYEESRSSENLNKIGEKLGIQAFLFIEIGNLNNDLNQYQIRMDLLDSNHEYIKTSKKKSLTRRFLVKNILELPKVKVGKHSQEQVLSIQKQAEQFKRSGDKYFENENYQSALNSYKLFMEINSNDVNIVNKVGVCHYYLGNYENAIYLLNISYNLNKVKTIDYLYYTALSHLKINDFDNAKSYISKLEKRVPNSFHVFHSLAIYHALNENFEKCSKNLEKAIKLSSQGNSNWVEEEDVFKNLLESKYGEEILNLIKVSNEK